MGDPESKSKHSAARRRNFLVKKLRTDQQFRKKIHIDEKSKQKEKRWSITYEDYEDFDS